MEHIDIAKGILKVTYSDRKIAKKIKIIYGIGILRRIVGKCRKELGIPNSYRRINTYYPPIDSGYSCFFSFNKKSVKKNPRTNPAMLMMIVTG